MNVLESNPNYVEDEQLRQENTRIFIDKNNPKKRIAVVAGSYSCYKQGDKLEIINLDLNKDYNNFIGSTSHAHNVFFKKTSRGTICLFGYGENKYYGYKLLDDVNESAPCVNENKVIYKNIYDGIDVEFENLRTGISKKFIVHSLNHYRDLTVQIVASKVNIDWDENEKKFRVLDKSTGDELWRSLPITVDDSSVAGPPQPNDSELTVDFSRINEVTYEISIRVSTEYLKKCKFPIFIDPSTNVSINWYRIYQSSYRNTQPPHYVSGVVTDGGKYIARVCFGFNLGGISNVTKISEAKFYANILWNSRYPEYTHIRKINSWVNGQMNLGWGNKPTDLAAYEDAINFLDYGYKSWSCTNMVRDWIINKLPNNGLQLDSIGYEGKANYAWRKYSGPGSSTEPYLQISYETNNPPTTPSSIGFGSNTRFQSSIPLTWPASTDQQGDTIRYIVEVQKNGGSWSVITSESGITETSFNYNISGDAPGTTYRFAVQAYDGKDKSGWAYSSICYKNKIPTIPANLKCSTEWVWKTAYLSWASSSDPENDKITYCLLIEKNGVTLPEIDGISNLSYTVDVSGDSPLTKYRFKVRAKDSMGGYSEYTDFIYGITKTRAPRTPKLSYPSNGATVYGYKPKIMIAMDLDPDACRQSLYVCWDGVWYNSVDNASMFSTSGNQIPGYKQIIWTPSSNQGLRTHTLKLKSTNDRGAESDESQEYKISIVDPGYGDTKLISKGTIYKASDIYEYRSAINNLRRLYGLNSYTFTDSALIIHETLIKDEHIIELRAAIDEIVSKINSWDINNKNPILNIWSDVRGNNESFLLVQYFSEIRNAILKI